MIWDTIRGHTNVREQFATLVANGRLSHAYLFLGPRGIGKSLFARTLAACLLCERRDDSSLEACGECGGCRQTSIGSHPDLFLIGLPAGKRELPVDLFIGPRERRGQTGLCHELSLRPMAGSRKLAIIDDADRMNEESANALLKTLEEPPAASILILVAANEDRILPTIRSRCHAVRFAPLPDSDIAELLIENEFCSEGEEAAAIAALANGSLDTAKHLVKPEMRALRDRLFAALSSGIEAPLQLAEEFGACIDDLGDDAAEKQSLGEWVVQFAVEFYRQCVWSLSAPENGPEPTDEIRRYVQSCPPPREHALERTLARCERALEACEQFQVSVRPAYCFESLFCDLRDFDRSLVQPQN